MVMIDGRPRFILGLYENPADDTILREAIEAGFNFIQCGPNVADLDRVRRMGASAWVNVGHLLDFSENMEARRRELIYIADQIGKHSALLAWEGPDEALWSNWWKAMQEAELDLEAMRTAAAKNAEIEKLYRLTLDRYHRGLYSETEELRRRFRLLAGLPLRPKFPLDNVGARVHLRADGIAAGIQALRKFDSNRIIWLNHAPRNSISELRLYNRGADMVGCDIYPVPPNLGVQHSALRDTNLTAVGAYTRRMRATAPGKACAMVLQGFGWRDLEPKVNENEVATGIGRRPFLDETRFMAYDAIVHGANAIVYWGTSSLAPKEGSGIGARPQLWHDLLRLARELNALQEALVSEPITSPVVRQAKAFASIEDQEVLYAMRRVREDYVIIVVNESKSGTGFSMENLPVSLNGRIIYRLYSNEEKTIERRAFSDGIRSLGVHIYSTSKRFQHPARI